MSERLYYAKWFKIFNDLPCLTIELFFVVNLTFKERDNFLASNQTQMLSFS